MKKLTLLLVMVLTSFLSTTMAQVTITDYDGTDMEFGGWNGSEFLKVANPYSGGINTSANVGEFSHAGNNWWSGLASTLQMSAPIDFTATPYIKMKVYSQDPIFILLKMENFSDGGINSEVSYQMDASETGKWTELFFDFSHTTHTTLDKVVLFIDPDMAYSAAGTKYYFDDIVATNVPLPGKVSFNPATGATGISVQSSLELTSTIALRMIDDSEITDPASVVSLKKADANGVDVPFTATISDDKKTISITPIDLLDASTVYWYGIKDNMIEYYIEDAEITGVSSTFTSSEVGFPAVSMMLDFDGINKTALMETLGDPAPAYSIVNDPAGGINQVFQLDKGTSWGGWERVHLELSHPIVVEDGKAGFIMKVYSPKENTLRFKLSSERDDNQGVWKEADVDITKINEWETLYIEFSELEVADYKHLLIFFDAGSADVQTYYFDDLKGPEIAAPAVRMEYMPEDASTGVQLYKNLSITSNYILKNTDGSTLTDLSGKVALRKGSSTGEDVAITATINASEKIITINPVDLLDVNTTYWYGIVDNTMAFASDGSSVTNVNATFTTRVTAPIMVTYNNFEGTSLSAINESMGDPAGLFMENAFDPVNASNTVAQWDKGGSWWGWERIHFELNDNINLSGDKIFSIKVYSPKTTYVRFKVGNQKDESGQTAYEVDADISAANEWQTLYFDLEGIDTNVDYKHVFVFIDGGNTDASTVFYVDDLMGPALGATTAIIENGIVNKMTVNPNPAFDVITILNVEANALVEIYNISGSLVKNEVLNGNCISIADLQNGVYFVKVANEVIKIIKK